MSDVQEVIIRHLFGRVTKWGVRRHVLVITAIIWRAIAIDLS